MPPERIKPETVRKLRVSDADVPRDTQDIALTSPVAESSGEMLFDVAAVVFKGDEVGDASEHCHGIRLKHLPEYIERCQTSSAFK